VGDSPQGVTMIKCKTISRVKVSISGTKEEMDKLHGALLLIKRLPADVKIKYSYKCKHGIDINTKGEQIQETKGE
tara:strand:- start:38 stop:262 length:225 start_codon:yes stop_codon:yes gene_type:complete